MDMTKKYILPHFGLGDAIICNALVRNFCKMYDGVVYFTADPYHASIEYMFRDIKNLSFINSENDPAVSVGICKNFISSNKIENDIIEIGFEGLAYELTIKNPGIPFYEGFYTMFNLNPKIRFSEFYYQRNFQSEEYVYNKLNPNNEKYIFVIDDSEHHLGNLIIDENILPKKYKIIKYDKKLNYNDENFLMFNYCKILENAEEIHTIETAFLEFIQSIKLSKPKIYIHSYLRNYLQKKPTSNNDYLIINSKGVN
jgi:hypothetical protein